MVRFSIRFDIRFFDVGTGKSNGRVFTRFDFASDSAFDFLFGEQVLCILLSRLLKIIEIMSMKVQNFSVNVLKKPLYTVFANPFRGKWCFLQIQMPFLLMCRDRDLF